jgi:hypothetical protein
MNCRTFYRNLEDYLGGGLDFAGRFGMERHAQQCISCGKQMADALQLRRMVSEVKRVKAPADFESSVLKEIGIRKARGRYSGFRKLGIFGLEWPSMGKLAMASLSLVVLGFTIFYLSGRTAPERASVPPIVVSEPAGNAAEALEAKVSPGAPAESPAPKVRAPAGTVETAENVAPSAVPEREDPAVSEQKDPAVPDAQEADYLEYMMTGPDNRAVPVRMPLPRVIPVRYSQMSEEYFIQNVSH